MSISGEDIQDLLEEHCCTYPWEMDKRKPVISNGDSFSQNPSFDLQAAHYDGNPGTSFFFNFDWDCCAHLRGDELGDEMREEIARKIGERVVEVFISQFPDDPPSPELLREVLEVKILSRPHPGFNNGEAYAWFRGLPLGEDFALALLKEFKHSFDEDRIIIHISPEPEPPPPDPESDLESLYYPEEDKDYPVWFYGWGFRYY